MSENEIRLALEVFSVWVEVADMGRGGQGGLAWLSESEMQETGMWTLNELIDYAKRTHKLINGKWVPARPFPRRWLYELRYRLRGAWLVVCGKADVFVWPDGQ